MMKIIRCALTVALACWWGVSLGQEPSGAVRFDVPVLPEAARYLELLTVPAYLALALENTGLGPSVSSRLTIRSRESVQIKAGTLRYVGRKGSIFNYEAEAKLHFGVGESDLTVRVEVDTSALSRGELVVRVYPPLAKLVPQDLIDRVAFKIRTIADLESQGKVMAYLDQISTGMKDRGQGFEPMLEAIAFEAYNASARSLLRGNRGAAEPGSDQIALAVMLAIWLLGFPLFMFFVSRRRKGQRAS